jgi:dTDP-4-amino-4,6-dideoxygalactose transaminase
MTHSGPLDFLAFGRPSFADDEIEAVARAMRSDAGTGDEATAFEGDLAACVGAAHVVSVDSPASALFLSLSPLNLRAGDEVICPSLAPCGSADGVLHAAAQPVFCDIDPITLCVTPETVVRHITARTKAVIVAHTGGLAADVAALRAAVPAHIAIVEDATHAMGARYADGAPVGSSGNLTSFSIHATAGDSAGEGGAIAAFDGDVAQRLRAFRQRMNCTGTQASIGRVQLRRLPELAYHRQTLARHYVDALKALEPSLEFQHQIAQPAHARRLLLVKLPTRTLTMSRNDVLAALRRRHVDATAPYKALHTMAAYRSVRQPRLPQAEALADQLLALPINGTMTPGDVDYVVAQVLDVLSDARFVAMAS